MKRLSCLVMLLALAVSCGPSRHSIHVEMRHPSKSGIDLAGKNVSVVYLENDNPLSNGLGQGIADGLANSIEQDNGTGYGSVGVYMMRAQQGGDYSSRDTLVNLLIDTGSDLVFLIDTLATGELAMGGSTSVASPVSPDSSYIATGGLRFTMKMYCFDGMDKSEKVHTYNGSSTAVPYAYSNGRESVSTLKERAISTLPELGFEAGSTVSNTFKSQWKHEQYSVVYFDSVQWINALNHADAYDWKSAIDIWLKLLDTNDMLKRSCAAYNLSVATYMLGEYELASQWLDRSDADNRLPLSDALRKRINERKR